MRLPYLSAIALSLALTSCDSTTEYQGAITNQTGRDLTLQVFGEKILRENIEVENGSAARYYYSTSRGDNEVFDCAETFDSIKFTIEGQEYMILGDTATFDHNSWVSTDQTRVHECGYLLKIQ